MSDEAASTGRGLVAYGRNYIEFNGFNVTAGLPVLVQNSTNVNVRRVCAWNADPDSGGGVFYNSNSSDILFEDCAGWGTGRKIFASYLGSRITYRRCFGRWEGCSSATGPKMTFSGGYNQKDVLLENCVGTWDWNGSDIFISDQAYHGIFAGDGDGSVEISSPYNSRQIGCVSYITSDQATGEWTPQYPLWIQGGLFRITNHNTLIRSCAAYSSWSNSDWASFKAVAYNGKISDCYELGDGESAIQIPSDWTVVGTISDTGYHHFSDMVLAGMLRPELAYRVVDGGLSDVALWPWPMNARILGAMTRNPIDVTKTVLALPPWTLVPNVIRTNSGVQNVTITAGAGAVIILTGAASATVQIGTNASESSASSGSTETGAGTGSTVVG